MLINLKFGKMKIIYRILLSITALALITLTSCLDDSTVGTEVTRFDKVPYVVDFNEIPNSDGYIIRSFAGTTDPNFAQEASFRVNLSSPYQLDYDLDVTVEFDPTAAAAYAAENAGWVPLAASKQDLTSVTVTILAGEREADFTVNFYTEGLSADDKIVAAYTITDVDDPDVIISGNFGTQYVKVGVANIFEGTYDLSDNFWGSPTTNYTAYMSDPVDLVTVSSRTSVLTYFYAGWGDSFYFEVDLDNPATIDGHADAYYVTVTTPGWAAGDQEQIDDYNGGVWNYCYQDAGKWVFKICHEADSYWFGYATYTQQ